jgi:hypothetical protein
MKNDSDENGGEKRIDIPENWLGFDLARESELLLQRGKTNYSQREGRGAHREYVVSEFLSRRLPGTVSVGKGHIQDSHISRTSECDIVLYDPLLKLVLGESAPARSVFPVESVRAVVEVRTRIDEAAIADAAARITELSKLRRYYCPTSLALHCFAECDLADLSSGLSATEHSQLDPGFPAVPVFLIGFEGITYKRAQKILVESNVVPRSILCVGKYQIQEFDTEAVGVELRHFSLTTFLISLMRDLMDMRASDTFFVPDFARYLSVPDELIDGDSDSSATT